MKNFFINRRMSLRLMALVGLTCALTGFSAFSQEGAKKGLPDTVKRFLDWEFNANAFNKQERREGGQAFKLQHLEIPLKAISEVRPDMESTVSESMKSSLIFEKNGEKYIRWIINPEDTKYTNIFMKNLEKRKIPFKVGQYFNGYLTASRSIVVEDPQTGNIFSGKVSTNKTGGAWKDKQVNFVQADKARLASTLLDTTAKHVPYKHMQALSEPLAFVFDKGGKGEEAFIMRDLHEMAEGKKYYMPGFAAIHSKAGREIAKANGSDNPAEFWKKHYAAALGKAMAENAAYHGLTYASAHSQQYAVELDENLRPTGKMVLRDFNDSFAMRSFFDNAVPFNKEFMDKWLFKFKRKDLRVKFDIFRGSGFPDWLNSRTAEKWSDAFYDAFEETFTKITQIPEKVFKAGAVKSKLKSPNEGSKVKTYKVANMLGTVSSKEWRDFLNKVPCFQGAERTKDKSQLCSDVLEELEHNLHKDYRCGI